MLRSGSTPRSSTSIKTRSQVFAKKAQSKLKHQRASTSLKISLDSLPHETSESIYKRVMTSRSHSSPNNIAVQRCLNPHRKFQTEFNCLVNAYPDFPSIMMKTLVLREKGNLKAVHSFLQKRGWKSSDKKLKKLSNAPHIHFTLPFFWGKDKQVYSSRLENEDSGSYFIVLDSPVYFIYYKTENSIKKQRISSPDILELPLYKVKHFTKPVSRPCTISDTDLLFLC